MKNVLFQLFLSWSFLSSNLVLSQVEYELDKTTRFEHMGAEEGLSSGYTFCVHQDKYGFIWIGTQLGLNLYNGYEVKIISGHPGNPHVWFNGWIRCISEETDGTMWFGTEAGIIKYNRANQTFTNYIPDTTNINSDLNFTDWIIQDGDHLWVGVTNNLLRFNKKTGLFRSFGKDRLNPAKGIYGSILTDGFIDDAGVFWVGSGKSRDDYALSQFNKETGTFVHYTEDPSDPESFVGKPVRSMIEDSEGTIWVATFGGGLLKIIDKEKDNFKQYAHDEHNPNSLMNNNLLAVFEDSTGRIWTTGENGFSLFNKNTDQFTNFQIPHRQDDSTQSNFIRSINEDKRGELWMSALEGFFRFDPTTRVLKHYLFDPVNRTSLSHNIVVQIMHDRSGQDWILTTHNGINRFSQFSNSFQKIERNNSKNSISGNFIMNFLGDSKGNLWIGTLANTGLNRTLLREGGDFSDFECYMIEEENPKSINKNSIFSIDEDKEQTIWVGTTNGLNRYNAQDNNFTRFEHDPDDPFSINSGLVEVAFEDSHGTFWVGTREGLDIMDKESGKFLHLLPDKNKPGTISSSDIRAIHEDSKGELWFGGTFLSKLVRKDTSFINYFFDSIYFQEVEKVNIWKIVEDDSANLWMTTWRNGLIKLQRSDLSFVSITTEQGLPSNTIMAIEIDDRGYIWASTTKGISKIDPWDFTIHNYDAEDGLVSREFIEQSSFKDKYGWLYFGGRNGFTYFHPDSIKENKFIPPVYITSLNVGGEPKYFDQPLYELGDIELQYNENDFSFDFVALNYINSNKNQYAYMLEGYDEDWQDAGNRRTAFYTNLSPGTYTFRVKGSNNDGYWNEEGARLGLVILPPFWKTWRAYTFYVLLMISIAYIVFRFYLRRQRLLHDLELKQVQAEQLAVLDQEKSKFFSNISHEFRTPLTLILGPLDRVIERLRNEDNKTDLSMVRRSALRLQTLINQLLSLSKLESGQMKLKTRPENIVKLIRLYLQSFHSMAEDRGIKLKLESDAEEYILYVDTIKFEKVVNNLLSNAFKFTEKGERIKVSITSQDTPLSPPSRGESTPHGVTIKVSDTGAGIPAEDLPHVFDRFYQVDETQMKTNLGTGIGLALTKELVELHHGTITVESEQGKGTTFTIFLPLGKAHLSQDEILVQKDSHGETENDGTGADDDLLNDDYIFLQDKTSNPGLQTELVGKKDQPLLLIVEDSEDMRSYIKSFLLDTYNIIEAANGKEGTEQAIEHVPDLIVSDLMMPKMDGMEMTAMLKTDKRTSHIPIILLTAKTSKDSKLEGLETGADDFLTKPFDGDELQVRIKNLIEQRQRLRKLLSKHIGDSVQTHIIKEATDKGLSSIDEQFLEKTSDIIDKRMADTHFSVEMLAGELAMSRMQLHRKLKGLTDQSASDFIRRLRLVKAAKLLKEGRLNITQISYEIGISSPSYFAKAFKEQFGVAPSEYK